MIYKNPKSIINKYLQPKGGNRISELEIYNRLSDSISCNKNVKKYTPEMIENEYVAEFMRRKLRKSPSKKTILKSINSLIPKQDPKPSEVLPISHPEEVIEKSSLPRINSGNRIIPRIKSAKRERLSTKNTSNPNSTPQSFNNRITISRQKPRLLPKDKAKAMYEYEQNVKNNFIPSPNEGKRLELNLKSFSCERLKTFKDFQIVKLFK